MHEQSDIIMHVIALCPVAWRLRDRFNSSFGWWSQFRT